MQFETYTNRKEESAERVELPYDDQTLKAAVQDHEGSRLILEHSPVLWMRAAIGAETNRGASYITDRELADRHMEGGFAEWDPQVAQSVSQYLQDQGFYGINNASD